MAGALPEAELFEHLELLGFEDVRITERFDCFGGTATAGHVATHLGVGGVNAFARRA